MTPRTRRPAIAVALAAAVLAVAVALAACSQPPADMFTPEADMFTPEPEVTPRAGYPGWPPDEQFELIPIPISTETAVGPNRFLLNLIDQQNESLVSADRPVTLNFFDLAADPATPVTSVEADYLPVADTRALYRASVDFSSAGEWGVEAVTSESDGGQRMGRMVFTVRESTTTPPIGAPAPGSETPTAATPAEIAAISTDDQPEPDFYATSVAGALAAGEPFLLIFGTPAFCATATCGAALDNVKAVAADYREGVDFIHVEPYQLEIVDGSPRLVLSEQNFPIPVESVTEWGLPTEPYIFIVDSSGNVTAKFEGVASEDELRAALDEVAR
ncbi:MAG TPA: hypothetical protein VNW68_08605 [Candidatus Limnocylindria bacterium]|nr:hypothetical protein [Candidatus Limnocylindria bacterium]